MRRPKEWDSKKNNNLSLEFLPSFVDRSIPVRFQRLAYLVSILVSIPLARCDPTKPQQPCWFDNLGVYRLQDLLK